METETAIRLLVGRFSFSCSLLLAVSDTFAFDQEQRATCTTVVAQ